MSKPFDGAKAAYEDAQSRLDELKRRQMFPQSGDHDSHVLAQFAHENVRKYDRNAPNAKFIEIAKLLGLEATYLSGMYRVKHNGQFIGQMSAEAWLDHIRHCMSKANRS